MTKALKFDGSPQSSDRLRFLHHGLCQSPKAQQPREIEVLRREGSLIKRLEAVSVPDPAVQPGGRWQFIPRCITQPGEVFVEQADLNLLRDYVLAMPWSPMVAEVVVDAVEWALGAPEAKV